MTVFPAPGSNCGHRAGIPVFGGHLPNHVLAVPRPSPNVGEAKEVEAGPIRLRMARALSSLRAEVDEARLVGVERESVPSEALAEDRQHAFGGIDVVERHQRVVGEPDKDALPSQTRFHHGLEPFVQHMVREDVQEAGRDDTPLRGALGRAAQETVFDGSCFQPFVDHP